MNFTLYIFFFSLLPFSIYTKLKRHLKEKKKLGVLFDAYPPSSILFYLTDLVTVYTYAAKNIYGSNIFRGDILACQNCKVKCKSNNIVFVYDVSKV